MRPCGCKGDRGRHLKSCTGEPKGSATATYTPFRPPPLPRQTTYNIGDVIILLKRGLECQGRSFTESSAIFQEALKAAKFVEGSLGSWIPTFPC